MTMDSDKLFNELVLAERRVLYKQILRLVKDQELLAIDFMLDSKTTPSSYVGECRGKVMELIWKAMWVREELEHKHRSKDE